MAIVFDAETLTRLFSDAEIEFSVNYPCILDRLSLAITASTAEYTIPDYVHSIKRVTWKGTKVWPMPARTQRQAFQSATQTGKPFWYIFNNINQNKISLYPVPSETIAAGTGDLWGPTEISARFIVEFWRVADGITYTIPTYLRRRLLKLYVAKQAYALESKGQKLKNRDYFTKRWAVSMQAFSGLIDELQTKPRKLVVSGGLPASRTFPQSPLLPIDRYGISVETGE